MLRDALWDTPPKATERRRHHHPTTAPLIHEKLHLKGQWKHHQKEAEAAAGTHTACRRSLSLLCHIAPSAFPRKVGAKAKFKAKRPCFLNGPILIYRVQFQIAALVLAFFSFTFKSLVIDECSNRAHSTHICWLVVIGTGCCAVTCYLSALCFWPRTRVQIETSDYLDY